MNNLKPIMKQTTLGSDIPGANTTPNFGKGLLKKKPFGKPVSATPKAPAAGGLMQRLTGKC